MDWTEGLCNKNKVYQFLPSIAYAPGRVQIIKNVNSYDRKEEKYYSMFRQTGLSNCAYIDSLSTYARVKCTRTNLKLSLEKCNTSPKWYRNLNVDNLIKSYLGPYLSVPVCHATSEYEINTKSSPAKFWKRMKCKTKGDVLKHPELKKYAQSTDHVPVVDYNSKVELQMIDDIILKDKIRGTFNPPFDFLLKQKLLYDVQNQMFINDCKEGFIKHGFVKQYGGFNDLGKKLENSSIISFDDVTGWDREIYLELTYELRNLFLICPDWFKDIQDYVTYFTINPVVACPDGVLRRRLTGNISGSNNTTTDNSIAHLYIKFTFINELWERYMRRPVELWEIRQYCCINIYSDDNLVGYNLPFEITLDDFWEIKQQVYGRFGLKLKLEEHYLVEHHPGARLPKGVAFLGSEFHWDEALGAYLPIPNVEKLASSLKYEVKSTELYDIFNKALALTALSVGVPELYSECLNFTKFLLSKVDKPEKAIGQTLTDIIKSSEVNPLVFANIYLGREDASSLSKKGL